MSDDKRLLNDERWLHLLMVASDLDDEASDLAITELRADRAARREREAADVALMRKMEHDMDLYAEWCDRGLDSTSTVQAKISFDGIRKGLRVMAAALRARVGGG